MKPVDLIGQRFGRLLVVSAEPNPGRRLWRAVCDCGASKLFRTTNLKNGSTQSCGCLALEVAGKHAITHGHSLGGRFAFRKRSKEYRCWAHILGRCNNPKDRSYKDYGGRGISVCQRWMTFEHFLEDMGSPPNPSMSIDRINNDGNYEPGNCRWATTEIQSRNQRRTIRIFGVCMKDFCEAKGLSYSAVQARLRRGIRPDLAISPLTGREFRAMLAAAPKHGGDDAEG